MGNGDQTISKKKKCKKAKGYRRRPYKQPIKEEKQKAKEKGKDIPTECRVPENCKRDKKAFLSEQCEENRGKK